MSEENKAIPEQYRGWVPEDAKPRTQEQRTAFDYILDNTGYVEGLPEFPTQEIMDNKPWLDEQGRVKLFNWKK